MSLFRAQLEMAYVNGSKLTAAQYAVSFVNDLVAHAGPKLEDARKAHADASEDGLTHTLLATFSGTYQVSHDTLAGGHVDVHLKHPVALANVLVGEAKIIDGRGFDWYRQGLTKLVGKYNTGRNPLALMIAYCRRPNCWEVRDDILAQVATNTSAFFLRNTKAADAGLNEALPLKVTTHNASGTEIHVAHVWIDMFYETDKELLSRAEANESATTAGAPTVSAAGGDQASAMRFLRAA